MSCKCDECYYSSIEMYEDEFGKHTRLVCSIKDYEECDFSEECYDEYNSLNDLSDI